MYEYRKRESKFKKIISLIFLVIVVAASSVFIYSMYTDIDVYSTDENNNVAVRLSQNESKKEEQNITEVLESVTKSVVGISKIKNKGNSIFLNNNHALIEIENFENENSILVIKNSYAKQLTNEEKETQEKIARYQKELDNLEAQIVAITSVKVGEDYVGGEFAWPAPGYSTITSKYGMRVHPILKTHRIHSGTDIAMPMGAYIIAANDGVVTKAGYSTTGYGNMVLIDHGGGVSTLYGHGSEILVQAGQTVKRGDIIMKAGSTGWSTGPHLHFEVRINGQHVDSLPYITGKKIETKSTENNAEESTQNTENAN